MLTAFDKAIVAVIVPMLLAGLAHFGISAETSVGTAVGLLVNAALIGLSVYFMPNKG